MAGNDEKEKQGDISDLHGNVSYIKQQLVAVSEEQHNDGSDDFYDDEDGSDDDVDNPHTGQLGSFVQSVQ